MGLSIRSNMRSRYVVLNNYEKFLDGQGLKI